MNPSEVVGLSEWEAVERIQEARILARVVNRDGKELIRETDARDDRINLEIKNSKVTHAYIG